MRQYPIKICLACGKKYAPTGNRQKRCGECCVSHNKAQAVVWRQTEKGKAAKIRARRKYLRTIGGHLRNMFGKILYRCNNYKSEDYVYYGGRGIKCMFTSLDDFRNYVVSLGYDTYEKIKGLQIDRIDNNGHYEKGNIRFVTNKENCNNRRKRKDARKQKYTN